MEYKITTLIDFNSPVLGTQHAKLKSIKDFKTEIAPCRTFCFLHELEMLLQHNLIKGGDINNAIVIVDKPVSKEEINRLAGVFKKDSIEVKSEGYLNNLELRFPNEPARHKLLDVVGDLALIGYPIKAHIIANRPGHSSNVEFAKKIKQYIKKNKQIKNVPVYDPNQAPVYTTQQIEKILPHRYPFLLVDKVIELSNTRIVGIKNVTFNEPPFQGHFPDRPVYPGVMMIEAMAQTAGVIGIKSVEGTEKPRAVYFLTIDKCKFRKPVLPGDTIEYHMRSLGRRKTMWWFHGDAKVNGQVVAEADVGAMLTD
jgi:UDP-3-O-[3-hydroxymyristoyl] N-acetylglucosamine deacetylase/3-hydroxyacyl-[acyl-carrier-protein] dehydratase